MSVLSHFYETVQGWFNFQAIYTQAATEARDGDTLVEVGSWYGRSAAFMAVELARLGKKCRFCCVDTWKGSIDSPWMAEGLRTMGGSALPAFRENMRRGGVEHLIEVVECPSVEAATRFANESLAFVMIDGSHDYKSVRADVTAWLPKVRPGAILAGDDAGAATPGGLDWPEVMLGVRDLIPLSELQLVNNKANWTHRKVRPTPGTWTVRAIPPVASDVLAYIPVVNRPDLLDKAVLSVRSLWPSLIVIDQTQDGLAPDAHPWLREIAGVYRIPYRAITFSQMMNWAQAEARERGVDYLVFMHSDAECLPGAVEAVLDRARSDPKAGIVLSNYDAFACFQMTAVREVGCWDETFEWYVSDCDYYYRAKLRGWTMPKVAVDLVLHGASATIKSDALIFQESGSITTRAETHYRHKWGGPVGAETHHVPYNGRA